MGLTRPQLTVLLLSVVGTVATWFAFMRKIPAIDWSAQPLPFLTIHSIAWHVGPMTDTTAFLGVLLVAYLLLIWVVWRADGDLPSGVILAGSIASGVFAALTYALFAEDVNVVLANVWTYAIDGLNPYIITPNAAVGNPWVPYTGWGSLEYVYGPAWLAIGGGLMKLIGPGIVANVMWTKVLMMLTLWLMAAIAWQLARERGSNRPVAAAAIVALNPLLLADGVMTPHLDLPMAAALLAALLAWSSRRHGDAIALFALSIVVKFITVVLAPVFAVGMIASLRGARGSWIRQLTILGGATLATGLAMAALWPGVWKPFIDHGLQGSLAISANSALMENVFSGAQALGLVQLAADPTELARDARWPLFIPFWIMATALGVVVSLRTRAALPFALFGPMAVIMLGYHLFFTVWLLPWHLMTALCLCLVAPGRVGLLAGTLVTASGVLLYLNAQWAWGFPWPDPRAVGWVLGGSLTLGPILACVVLVVAALRAVQARPSAP